VGSGSYGDDHVRFALIENEQRMRQAFRSMKKLLSGADLPVDGV
jgi:alanine-synthesizing transaminase